MAIRSPKYNSQGFTLLEMLTVVGIVGVLASIAVPSLTSLNKPLRDGVNQFKSHLSLVRTKAIASNKAYRIKPKFTNIDEYSDGIARSFVVEYANNCKVTATGAVNSGWERASQFDLDLPSQVGITDDESLTLEGKPIPEPNSLDWNSGQGVCFDNRGIVDTSRDIVIKDFQGNSKARLAKFEISKVGGTEIKIYNKSLEKLDEGNY